MQIAKIKFYTNRTSMPVVILLIINMTIGYGNFFEGVWKIQYCKRINKI